MSKVLAAAVLLLLLVGLTLCLVSCGGAPPPSAEAEKQVISVRVSGAWALYPMMLRWAEEYQRLHPEVQVGVWSGGSGQGVADALGGVVDIGMVSRAINPQEEKQGAFWVPVVRDAVVAVTNDGNPVGPDLTAGGLTREQCAALWLGGKEVTWGSLVSKPSAREKVRVYVRSDVCGAAEAWAQYLGKHQDDLVGTGVYGDPGIVEAIRSNPLGIGFTNLSYAYDAKTDKPVVGLMPIPIDINGDRQISESENCYGTRAEVKQAIAEGAYPSPPARDLNLLTKGKPEGLVRGFVLWVLNDGQKYVDEAGYVKLPQERLEAAVKKVG